MLFCLSLAKIIHFHNHNTQFTLKIKFNRLFLLLFCGFNILLKTKGVLQYRTPFEKFQYFIIH
ncbi:hypothetical protein BXU10_00825 [Flavobacterium sp. LM4]|nr:hypothetical protein BXU10_00825 [Flavobacterium sp. LM4]